MNAVGSVNKCIDHDPNVMRMLLTYVVVDILAASTCPAHLVDPSSVLTQLDYIELLRSREEYLLSCWCPCPQELLQVIIHTNVHRHCTKLQDNNNHRNKPCRAPLKLSGKTSRASMLTPGRSISASTKEVSQECLRMHQRPENHRAHFARPLLSVRGSFVRLIERHQPDNQSLHIYNPQLYPEGSCRSDQVPFLNRSAGLLWTSTRSALENHCMAACHLRLRSIWM